MLHVTPANVEAVVHIALDLARQPKLIPLARESLPQPLHARYGMLSLRSFAAPTVFKSGAN